MGSPPRCGLADFDQIFAESGQILESFGREDGRVDLLRLAVERAGRERPRVVGGVALDRAPGVDHDELAGTDLAVARPRVRARAGRARSDDRLEGDVLCPFLVEEPGEIP